MATAGERLHLLYEINRRLATCTDLDDLLRYATQRAREVLEAEGCALLLLDAHRREFSFPISSQSVSRPTAVPLADIRFASDQGIAGWVISHDQAALVNDAQNDPRFFGGVDKQTTITTRALLCAPLRTDAGIIGVIEVMNPRQGTFTTDDLELLDAVASDIAVAYEKAHLHQQLRGEIGGLRQMCSLLGIVLAAVGIVVSLGAVVGHLARALPLGEVITRPSLLVGGLALLVGLTLLGIARGWLVSRTPVH